MDHLWVIQVIILECKCLLVEEAQFNNLTLTQWAIHRILGVQDGMVCPPNNIIKETCLNTQCEGQDTLELLICKAGIRILWMKITMEVDVEAEGVADEVEEVLVVAGEAKDVERLDQTALKMTQSNQLYHKMPQKIRHRKIEDDTNIISHYFLFNYIRARDEHI
jgi:hypothetical protein